MRHGAQKSGPIIDQPALISAIHSSDLRRSAQRRIQGVAAGRGEPFRRRGERPGDGRECVIQLAGAEEGFECGSHFRFLFAFGREYMLQPALDQG